MSKLILEVWEGGKGSSPLKSVELDRDSRRYIHVRLLNEMKMNNTLTGELEEIKNYYPLQKC